VIARDVIEPATMRLINVQSLELETFIGKRIPSYAIISHTWGREEVSYAEYLLGEARCLGKKGYDKILAACRWASSEGFEYVWIDTCCIDKSSSAELSEAINSMYNWYRNAKVCGAYLSDVRSLVPEPGDENLTIIPDQAADDEITTSSSDVTVYRRRSLGEYRVRDVFAGSKWWTRGWTLQEFLAPGVVIFLASDWTEIGTRTSLRKIIPTICGVHEDALEGEKWRDFSVAQKMSWASQRNTTRLEDRAYCLMGLFDVNMPLLYGEGHKAFMRLQLEIWRQTADETLYAWSASNLPRNVPPDLPHTGLFAPTSRHFQHAQDIKPSDYLKMIHTRAGLKSSITALEYGLGC
jgi:hypothetical protein